MHVSELKRMGAKINIRNNVATIEGPTNLSGAEVMATDLRAVLSFGWVDCRKQNNYNRIYHLDRGYFSLEKNLKLQS